MLIHNFDPVAIDLNFLQIRWYSLAYIFGILIGWFYGRKIISKLRIYNNFNYLKIDDFDDLIPYLIIGIIIVSTYVEHGENYLAYATQVVFFAFLVSLLPKLKFSSFKGLFVLEYFKKSL